MNEILRPELIWIEGRCYRTNESVGNISDIHQEVDLYENDVVYDDADDGDEDFEVEQIDNSRFCTSVHVSKHYMGYVIGKKGAVKSRIERDTRTEIKIPKQGQIGDIMIYGSSAANVKAARRRINIIVMSSRMKQRATHFISIPMNETNITTTYEQFKENVLSTCSQRGIEESLFIRPHKLHLTVGVMCLMDNEERLLVSKLFTEAKDKIIMPLLQGNMPLRIRMKGLSYMNDDPKEIDVLYALVEDEGQTNGLLQRLCDAIVDYFYKAGYMNKEYDRDNVKLHVTLLNSKYRNKPLDTNNEGEDGSRRKRQTRETFDGSAILELYKDFDFGVMTLDTIHLSQRHTMGQDGYYQPTCIISCK